MKVLIVRRGRFGNRLEHIDLDDAEVLVRSGKALKVEDGFYDAAHQSLYDTKVMTPTPVPTPEPPAEVNPMDIPCSYCGAQAGEMCVTASGEEAAGIHKPRRKAAKKDG